MAKKQGVTDKQKGAAAAKNKGKLGGKDKKDGKINKGGGKPKKKSWTKVKVKDKLNNAPILDAKLWDRITKEAPKILQLSTSIMVDKFKVNGSVARRALRELTSKNLIRVVGDSHHTFTLYTGTQAAKPGSEPAAPAKK